MATTKKWDLSASDYFRRIKCFASALDSAGIPLRDDKTIAYLLVGLSSDYDSFVTSMTTRSDALTLDDVFVHLTSFEARQLQHQAEMQLHVGASANFAGHGG